MKSLKCTPAPWVPGPMTDGEVIIYSSNKEVATVYCGEVTEEECFANVDRICRSPELDCAARLALGWLEAADQDIRVREGTKNIRALLREALGMDVEHE